MDVANDVDIVSCIDRNSSYYGSSSNTSTKGVISGNSVSVTIATGTVTAAIVIAVSVNPACANSKSSTNRLHPVLSFLCILYYFYIIHGHQSLHVNEH